MKINKIGLMILGAAIFLGLYGTDCMAGWNQAGAGQGLMLLQLPKEDLSDIEVQSLSKMREEEKLARDVYLYLYNLYKTPLFNNIASSEQRHMDAVGSLLTKYGLSDPVAGLDTGEFASSEMQELYNALTTQGAQGLAQAYQVGATIEDLDIKDLKDLLGQVDNRDIRFAFQNLMKGSRNHLRAFTSSLKGLGLTYSAQYLSQQEVDEIINSNWERGPVDENGNPISTGRGRRGAGMRGRVFN